MQTALRDHAFELPHRPTDEADVPEKCGNRTREIVYAKGNPTGLSNDAKAARKKDLPQKSVRRSPLRYASLASVGW